MVRQRMGEGEDEDVKTKVNKGLNLVGERALNL